MKQINLGTGEAEIQLETTPGMFEQILAEFCGEDVSSDAEGMQESPALFSK